MGVFDYGLLKKEGSLVSGYIGRGGDNAQSRANQLLEEQINQSKQELEEKRQSLVQQRIAIVKSQGAEQWTPNREPGSSAPSAQAKQPGGFWRGFKA